MDSERTYTKADMDAMLEGWSDAFKDVIASRVKSIIKFDDENDESDFIIELFEGI